MQKLLFFDYRELDVCRGFERVLTRPEKRGPLLIADQPWEQGNMQLYGSVVKVPGKPFQLWYSTIQRPWNFALGYAESDDGYAWRRPLFDIVPYEGKPTNLVFGDDPHGPAVIWDELETDPEWQYKMVCGAKPTNLICTYRSPDGIHWSKTGRFPAITTEPDCPMGFFRARDRRYVCFHRYGARGRRVHRSESWDFKHWDGEPRLVLEPGPLDDCQTQFYGFGTFLYGPYEIGTLWNFHTDPAELGRGHMAGYQETELTFARSGYGVHRLFPGQAFLPIGGDGEWDRGNVQCASQPVLLDDEIRFYFMGTTQRHKTHWELDPQTAGIGAASVKPDRLVGLHAAEDGEVLTVAFRPDSRELRVNAAVAPGGSVRAEVQNARGEVVPGGELAACRPVSGDELAAPLTWDGAGGDWPEHVRLRLVAQGAALYSVSVLTPGETPCYHRFRPFW